MLGPNAHASFNTPIPPLGSREHRNKNDLTEAKRKSGSVWRCNQICVQTRVAQATQHASSEFACINPQSAQKDEKIIPHHRPPPTTHHPLPKHWAGAPAWNFRAWGTDDRQSGISQKQATSMCDGRPWELARVYRMEAQLSVPSRQQLKTAASIVL
ncbi:hypothetical protein B0T17DRAFT_507788 [Bombardia bombarda]|uniref:Uncharacterized protein n=1 Tax=Bombardia bombarda TaxID=252184 RepID=A0AA40C4G2_9PEZI|nr:hypothetical protein B0T17DRAFT_507788 [Bombardia bombarda]